MRNEERGKRKKRKRNIMTEIMVESRAKREMATCTSFYHGTHQFVIYNRAALVAHSSHSYDLLFPFSTLPHPSIILSVSI